nr:hypothetical protein [Bacteroides xylanisolvens]
MDECRSAALIPVSCGRVYPNTRYRLSMTATRYHVPVPEGGEEYIPDGSCRTIQFRMHCNGH